MTRLFWSSREKTAQPPEYLASLAVIVSLGDLVVGQEHAVGTVHSGEVSVGANTCCRLAIWPRPVWFAGYDKIYS